MNYSEFQAWARVTEASRYKWTLDLVFSANNPGEYFFYKGGESGRYVHISPTELEAGTYDGAIPHIMEAAFKPLYRFPVRDAALARAAVEKLIATTLTRPALPQPD